MRVEIKAYCGEQGALCLPLLQNVKEVKEGWKVVRCPQCKRECLRNTKLVDKAKEINPGLKELCTECALRASLGVQNDK